MCIEDNNWHYDKDGILVGGKATKEGEVPYYRIIVSLKEKS